MKDSIYMIHRYRENHEVEYPRLVHGAFRTYRGASEWLIKEGYKPYWDDDYYFKTNDKVVIFRREDKFYTDTCEIVEYDVS